MPLSERARTATTGEPRRSGPDCKRFERLIKTWCRATAEIRDYLVVERELGDLRLVDEVLCLIEFALSPQPNNQDWNIAVHVLDNLAQAAGFNGVHTAELTHALGGVAPEKLLWIRQWKAQQCWELDAQRIREWRAQRIGEWNAQRDARPRTGEGADHALR